MAAGGDPPFEARVRFGRPRRADQSHQVLLPSEPTQPPVGPCGARPSCGRPPGGMAFHYGSSSAHHKGEGRLPPSGDLGGRGRVGAHERPALGGGDLDWRDGHPERPTALESRSGTLSTRNNNRIVFCPTSFRLNSAGRKPMGMCVVQTPMDHCVIAPNQQRKV